MALVNDEWLGYDSRAQYLTDLNEELALLRALLAKGAETPTDLSRMEELLDEIERVQRVHRGEYDVAYFGTTYFSEDGNPGNDDNLLPEGLNAENLADFHHLLCGLFNDIATGRQTKNTAYSVPRQHGKTAWISNIFLLHQVVYRHRKYIVLFSETTDVAGDFITWGRYQLKLNAKLREDFGELLHKKPSLNQVDNKFEYITTSNTKVEAKGLGTQTRGLRYGSSRPDLLVLDDMESQESTNTTQLIEKSKSWFREEMLPATSRNGIVVYLGTILCYGSLLYHVIEDRKDFESRKLSAVEQFANREDLWEKWRRIYRSDDAKAGDKAEKFYKDNEEEMLRGTKILWPDYWSYYDFMVIREENGIKAFNQEYQNNPTDEERQVFKPESFHYVNEADVDKRDLTFYAGIDIAMGKETGDFSVITTIAKNERTNNYYVWDVYMDRIHPDVLIEQTIRHTLKYQYEAIGIETQFAQEFVADKLAEGLQANGYPAHTRIKHIKQRTRKALRIEALLPDIQNGTLRFRRDLDSRFFDQFFHFPMGNDDAPDSASMAYSTAQASYGFVRTTQKRMR